MKKLLVLTLIMFVSIATFAQTHLYENPNFDKIAQNHKIIAVMPFKSTVKLRPRQMKDMKPDQLAKMEVSEGEGVQSAMYSWFLKREKRGTLTVKVQSPAITDAKLKKAGITYDNMDGYTPEEIAKVIGVDAIVMGTFETSKPMSEGASIVLGALIGFWGATNKATLNLSIYNAADNELLVNYNKMIAGSLGSSTEDLVNVLMRKASRRIAYTKND